MRRTGRSELGEAVTQGAEAGGFFASLISGLLLGLLLDHWLETDPVFVVVGIVAGAATGFVKMWHYATRQDDPGR